MTNSNKRQISIKLIMKLTVVVGFTALTYHLFASKMYLIPILILIAISPFCNVRMNLLLLLILISVPTLMFFKSGAPAIKVWNSFVEKLSDPIKLITGTETMHSEFVYDHPEKYEPPTPDLDPRCRTPLRTEIYKPKFEDELEDIKHRELKPTEAIIKDDFVDPTPKVNAISSAQLLAEEFAKMIPTKESNRDVLPDGFIRPPGFEPRPRPRMDLGYLQRYGMMYGDQT